VYVPPTNTCPGLGEIRLQVEKPFYLPGETVNGKAYFMIGSATGQLEGVAGISIHIEGDERAEYTRHWTTTSGSGKNRRTKHHSERRKMSMNLFQIRQTVCQPLNGIVANGIHDLTFSFTLPPKVPSSMLYSVPGTHHSPIVAITYSIKAMLHFAEGNPCLALLKGREFGKEKLFIVREPVDFNNIAV